MPGSMFSPKTKLIQNYTLPEYASETKKIDIEQLHDGTFICRGSMGYKTSYKTIAALIKGIKENFSSEQDDNEMED